MPLNPRLAHDERRRIDTIARPDFVIGERGAVELPSATYLSATDCERYQDDDLDDVATIIFTSGTTGTPKGVMLTGDALLANASSVARYLTLAETDRTLVFLPLHYTYTLSQIFSTWLAGGSIVLMRNLLYPIQAVSAIAEHRITGFGGVPTSLNILAGHQSDSREAESSLRYVLSAGGPLAPAVADKVQRRFPTATLYNNYGCTEIGPRATAINVAVHAEKGDSIGRPIPGVNVRIVRSDLSLADTLESGEIVLSGASLMKGYYRDEKTTLGRMSHHGFHTGDYGFADKDGFLYFEGRADDIFKSAGEKVSAREIENVLLCHEAIAETAVIAVDDPLHGAVPIAYAVLRPGASCTDRELRAFCAQHLSTHKIPRMVHLVPELYKTASGKVQKHRLREACL
jgi:acyl-CoA synthetase (AMP-forming)/AMP-acid ligase II